MQEKKHQKHQGEKKLSFGKYAKNELAIVGTNCSDIEKLAKLLSESVEMKLGYLDASHKEEPKSSGFAFDLVEHSTFSQFETEKTFSNYELRGKTSFLDLLLINGNHFEASNQIIVVDAKKESSLKKRLSELTSVQLVLLKETSEVFDFLAEVVGDAQVLSFNDEKSIVDWFKKYTHHLIPSLDGIVLAGGLSTRMGKDKGLIDYHGKPQREFLYELLKETEKVNKVSFSCRANQLEELEGFEVITDKFLGMGPLGAILSAFHSDASTAKLVLATDLPFVSREAIDYLIQKRNPSELATAFFSKETGFPDPLLTIYEPKSYPYLLQLLSQGITCPRKLLINFPIEVIEPVQDSWLTNVNTPQQLSLVQ